VNFNLTNTDSYTGQINQGKEIFSEKILLKEIVKEFVPEGQY
jgi:hypothetical protein